MKIRQTLFVKILLWFFLNLAVVGGLIYFSFDLDFRVGPDSAIFGRNQNRMRIVGFDVMRDISQADKSDWDKVLQGYSEVYKVDFSLFTPAGEFIAGQKIKLPPKIMAEIHKWPPIPFQGGPADGPAVRPSHPDGGPVDVFGGGDSEIGPPHCGGCGNPGCQAGGMCGMHGGFKPPHFKLKTSSPSQYWTGVRVPVIQKAGDRPIHVILIGRSDSITGNGLFMDPTPWIAMALILIVLSTILWIPLIRHISRPLRQMTDATERIAQGDFDATLKFRRNDEIGRLATAINEMAARLSRMIFGQKRFLGDAAHELASPLARMQLGISILEEQLQGADRDRVLAIKEDVQQMSELVDGLLSFSRSDPASGRVKFGKVNLFQVIAKVVDREIPDESIEVNISVSEDLNVHADGELISRAIANLVRNALRYAGSAGPIAVSAFRQGDYAVIEVSDSGPGVPEGMLQQIFEPFYRIESSRGRETGGVGLGLAIVKTAVTACHGTVTAANRTSGGLIVTIRLPMAPRSSEAGVIAG